MWKALLLTVFLVGSSSDLAQADEKVHVESFNNDGKVTSIVQSELRKAGFSMVGPGQASVIVSGKVIESGKMVTIVAKIEGKGKTYGESINGKPKDLEKNARAISSKIANAIRKL